MSDLGFTGGKLEKGSLSGNVPSLLLSLTMFCGVFAGVSCCASSSGVFCGGFDVC